MGKIIHELLDSYWSNGGDEDALIAAKDHMETLRVAYLEQYYESLKFSYSTDFDNPNYYLLDEDEINELFIKCGHILANYSKNGGRRT